MIQPLDDAGLMDRVVEAHVAVIYKHSPRCGSARFAAQEMERFATQHPEVPVYQVDVVRHRRLARSIAARLEVRHESPQVILLRGGRVVWVASHARVDADLLDAHFPSGPPGG